MDKTNTSSITVKFDIGNPEEKKIYDIIKKTGKRSFLAKIALSELIDKYNLNNVQDKDLDSFIKGYTYISRFQKEV